MLVADFYKRANRGGRPGDGDPVDVFNFESGGAKGVIFADNDAIGFGLDGEDVEWLTGGEAEAFALADSEIVDAIVTAEDFAGIGDDLAFAGADGNLVFGSVGVNELDVIAVWHETKLHAFGLVGDGQRGAMSDVANVALGELAEREFAAGKLFLRKSPEKIGLILAGIERTQELITVCGGIVTDAGVMAGRETVGADLAGHAKKRFELYVGVAVGAGDGSAAAEVILHKGTDDTLFELVLEIDDIVRKVEMLRDALGVVHVVE